MKVNELFETNQSRGSMESLGWSGLSSLRGLDIPDIIIGHFNCGTNQLTSLEFGPKEVEGDFFCYVNLLTSLDFCATKIGGELRCYNNRLTSLHGIHKIFKNGYVNGELDLQDNQLKSHVLGVILIPKVKEIFIDNDDMQEIINKHLKSGRDVLECQEELIQKGFKDFAQL